MHFEFAYFYFLLHLELKRKLSPCTPVVPSKTMPDSRQKWAKCVAVFRPKRPKNHTLFGGTYLITWNFRFTLISRYKKTVTWTMSVANITCDAKIKWFTFCTYKERTSLLSLKRLQITLFTFLWNAQCKWMLWSIDSRTIIAYKHELLVDIVRSALLLLLTLSPRCCVFLHDFDFIVPLIKSFYLIQRHVK